MDPISASNFNLSIQSEVIKSNSESEALHASCKSLSQIEDKSFKTLLPQILASVISTSGFIVVGISLTYSAILIPHLEDENSEIKATKAQTSWIASALPLVAPVGALLSAYLMDRYGRINALKLSTFPGIIGWIIIAVAWDIPTLVIGRVITGLASSLATNPSVVYITEIARPDMRGSLLTTGPALVSLGMVIGYVEGWLIHWRTVAWLCNIYLIVPTIFLFFVPESPVWLISKGKIEQARKSLQWLHKYQPEPDYKNETFAELHLDQLIRENDKKKQEAEQTGSSTVKAFFKSTGYKPLLILSGVFFFQQFCGIYIFLFYSVSFFDAVGTSVNPYAVSVLIGLIRFFMSLVNSWMLKTFNRRILMMSSALGMSVCTFISALFTYWLKNGTTTVTWVPIVFLLLYVVNSMIGFLPIPWTMTAEMFPLKIRSMAHSISTSVCNVIMFIAVQNYPYMERVLGGSAGVQWFFSGVSALAMVYVFVFLPETHGKKLSEIEEYFEENSIYILSRTKSSRSNVKDKDADTNLINSP